MNKLLTLEQAAEILQVDKETVRNYIKTNKLQGVKIAGWMWRIRQEDLEKFIAESANNVRTKV